MVKYYTDPLDVTFMALADSTRRAILLRLAEDEYTVSELAKPFAISLPAISKHLGILENAGLIVREKKGRYCQCRLEAGPMKDASGWIERYRKFWEEQFNALDEYLQQNTGKEEK